MLLFLLVFGSIFEINGANFNQPKINSTLTNRNSLVQKKKYEFWQKCLNETIDPCQDFYQFACGKYISDHANEGTSSYLIDENEPIIEKCMKTALTNSYASKSTAVKKMRQYHKSYLENEHNPVKLSGHEMIDDAFSFGSCPFFNMHWSSNKFDSEKALQKLTQFTTQMPLFKMSVLQMPDVSIALVISANKNGKTSVLYQKAFDLLQFVSKEARRTHIEKIYLQRLALKIFYLEEDVYGLMAKHNYYDDFKQGFNRDGESIEHLEKINFEDLNELLSSVGGAEYFKNNAFISSEVKQFLNKNPTIYIQNKDLLVELNNLYGSLDKKLFADYLCFYYIQSQLPYLNYTDVDDEKKSDNDDYYEDKSDDEADYNEKNNDYDEKIGIDGVIQKKFPLIADHLFVKNCISNSTIYEIQKLFTQVKDGAKQVLLQSKWLTNPETRKQALFKLKWIHGIIGAHSTSTNVKQLDFYYEELNFLADDSFRNMEIKLSIFTYQQKLNYLLKPGKFIQLDEDSAATINAYNALDFNAIYVYSGGLLSPSYDSMAPDSIKFGTIGFTLGHEISHSFGPTGTRYDSIGARSDWFDEDSFIEYYKTIDCLIQQYSNVLDEQTQTHLNGYITVEEDFADLLGIHASYNAFKKFGKSDPVSGYSHYNADQSFFIGYAVRRCASYSYFGKRLTIKTDTHSPNDYRVNEVLKNTNAFHKAFKCPIGSRMNPVGQCKIN